MSTAKNTTINEEVGGTVFQFVPLIRDSFSPHDKEMLRRNIVPGIVPVVFVREKGRTVIGYREEAYETLQEYIETHKVTWENQGEQLLGFGHEILRILLDAEEHFIGTEGFSLSEETVLREKKTGLIRILPASFCGQDSFLQNSRRTGETQQLQKDEMTDSSSENTDSDDAPEFFPENRFARELTELFRVLSVGFGDPAWNLYKERLYKNLTEKRIGLRSMIAILDDADRILYFSKRNNGKLEEKLFRIKDPLR